MAEPRGASIPAEVATAVADLAADLREWLAWAAETGAVEVPALEPSAITAAASTSAASAPRHRAPGAQTPSVARPGAAAGAPPRATTQPPPQARPATPAPRPGAPAPLGPRPAAAETLEHVRADLGACTRCPLHAGRKNIVFGVGTPVADLMIIGEAPGRQEDITGEPFVGRSGQLLARMLAAIGLERSAVYIANVVKCRPPENRDPEPHEVACCSPFLTRQIHAIRPRVILTLGRHAAWNLLGGDAPMHELRRQSGRFDDIPVVASYHPSYLLRTGSAKRAAWEDLLRVRAILAGV